MTTLTKDHNNNNNNNKKKERKKTNLGKEADGDETLLDGGELVGAVARSAVLDVRVRHEAVLAGRAHEAVLGLLLVAEAGEEQVEDVKRGLVGALVDDARLLEQVLLELGADDRAVLLEVDLEVFAEARRVVVDARLGVAERLEQRIDLLYLGVEAELERTRATQQVLHQVLARLGLAAAALARDQNALRLLCAHHLAKALLGRRVHVRRQLAAHALAPLIGARHLLAVDGQRPQRIQCDQDVADVCLFFVVFAYLFLEASL